MSHEQYWFGDVWMIAEYREAEKIRQERVNAEAWWQGLYVYDAMLKVSPVFHAFAKKGTKPQQYPNRPYSINGEKAQTANSAQMQENERLKSILFFKNWSKSVGKKFN